MTDQEVLSSIIEGGQSLENATQHMIQSNVGLMHDIMSKLNLSSFDVKDKYADAVSNLVWNIQTGKFKADSKISTYLYKILYNKSIDHLRHISTNKNRATVDIESHQHINTLDDEHTTFQRMAFNEVKTEILNLGTRCQGVIMDWAYYGYSMKEIAERNSIENADKAKKMKYTCLQKLRLLLKSKKIHY